MKRRWIVLAGVLAGLIATESVHAAADQIIWSKGGEHRDTLRGQIIQDDYTGVTVSAGPGVKTKKPRNQIVQVIYAKADNRSFDKALESYRAGDYEGALRLLEGAWQGIPRMPAGQRPLFSQYIRFYRGMCRYRMGMDADSERERKQELKQAREEFTKLIATVPDTAFYFEAKLTDAKCLEAFSPSQAADRYGFLLKDFSEKIQKAGIPWAEKYKFPAIMGGIRLKMEDLVSRRGNDDKVEALLGELRRLLEGGLYRKYGDTSTDAAATKIEALALTYLSKYKELIGILDAQIRSSQMNDDASSLGSLYLRRGGCYYRLAKEEEAAAKQKELQERALMDNLRADLVFALPRAEKAQANLRVAELFAQLRSKGWKTRAKKHLKEAKANGAEPTEVREVEDLLE